MMISNQHIILGKKELIREKFNPIKNKIGFNKPEGGIWASPYYPDKEYISGWHEWCSSEMEDWLSNDSVILELKDSARIFIIDSQNDLIKLINLVGTAEDEFTKSVKSKLFSCPDFEKASLIFDTILMTEEGQWQTRFSDDNCDYNLYGWDCESLIILNYDCIRNWKYKKLDIVKER